MRLPKNKEGDPQTVWRQCLECGNRYQASSRNALSNLCSVKCENAALRRQRDQVETTWIRATWFLR